MGGQPSRATLARGSEVWRDGIAIPVSGACPVNASLLVNVTPTHLPLEHLPLQHFCGFSVAATAKHHLEPTSEGSSSRRSRGQSPKLVISYVHRLHRGSSLSPTACGVPRPLLPGLWLHQSVLLHRCMAPLCLFCLLSCDEDRSRGSESTSLQDNSPELYFICRGSYSA